MRAWQPPSSASLRGERKSGQQPTRNTWEPRARAREGREDAGYRDIDRPRAILNNTHTHSRCAHMDRGAGMESGRLGSEASSREKCKAPTGRARIGCFVSRASERLFPSFAWQRDRGETLPRPESRDKLGKSQKQINNDRAVNETERTDTIDRPNIARAIVSGGGGSGTKCIMHVITCSGRLRKRLLEKKNKRKNKTERVAYREQAENNRAIAAAPPPPSAPSPPEAAQSNGGMSR